LTRKDAEEVAEQVIAEQGVRVDYLIGTMIEIPRACVTADQIAKFRRLLQFRHQRPDSDDLRVQPRRCGRQIHGALP
jgi:hypothetical protein